MNGYFESMYTSEGSFGMEGLNCIQPTISDEDNDVLTSSFTALEIKALFSMLISIGIWANKT